MLTLPHRIDTGEKLSHMSLTPSREGKAPQLSHNMRPTAFWRWFQRRVLIVIV